MTALDFRVSYDPLEKRYGGAAVSCCILASGGFLGAGVGKVSTLGQAVVVKGRGACALPHTSARTHMRAHTHTRTCTHRHTRSDNPHRASASLCSDNYSCMCPGSSLHDHGRASPSLVKVGGKVHPAPRKPAEPSSPQVALSLPCIPTSLRAQPTKLSLGINSRCCPWP